MDHRSRSVTRRQGRRVRRFDSKVGGVFGLVMIGSIGTAGGGAEMAVGFIGLVIVLAMYLSVAIELDVNEAQRDLVAERDEILGALR